MTIIAKENRTIQVPELENRKVVEHNDLISSVAKMDKTPLKIFELAVSYIDTKNPPKDNTVNLSKTEIYKFFDVSDNDKHSRFKKAITTLHKQSIFEIREINEKKGKYEYQVISPLEKTTWNDYSDILTIKFTSSIMPYLIELGTKYTQYVLTDIMELNSKYSIILYKWLSMNYNQYEYYSKKGGRTKEQLEGYKNPVIKVLDLRVITDTIKGYPRFDTFENWILKKPLEEISENTHFTISYDKIKKGRTIDSIQFHISKKEQPQEINGEYKAREQDPAYLQDKSNREVNQQALFAEAMQSIFTMELIDSSLISPVEMTDISLMANLQQEVYPLYKQLEEIVGIKGVRKHLEYVSSKKLDYSRPNLVKYLKTAVRRYLDSGDTEQPEESKTRFLKRTPRTIEEVAKEYL